MQLLRYILYTCTHYNAQVPIYLPYTCILVNSQLDFNYCQPHKVTQYDQTRHKQMHISTNFSYINHSSSKIHTISPYTNVKQSICKQRSNTNFKEFVHSIFPLLKRACTCWYYKLFHLTFFFIDTRLKRKFKKEWTQFFFSF